jgi:hypothetical protein
MQYKFTHICIKYYDKSAKILKNGFILELINLFIRQFQQYRVWNMKHK